MRLSEQTIQVLINYIDTTISRGAIRGEEIYVVADLRKALSNLLLTQSPKVQMQDEIKD